MAEASEDEKERLNRKLIELLNELRVALPGVQVLFAFLLILPFSQGFEGITDLQRSVFSGTFLSAALAVVLFIAPAAYHRLRHRQLDREELGEKEEMLITQHRLAVAGLFFLAVAMTGVVLLIFDVLFGTGVAALLALGVLAAFAWFWYGLPLYRRARDERTPSGRSRSARK